MANRAYAQKEWRLLSWWLATKHPHADISMNVRLGPETARRQIGYEDEQPATVPRVFHRYADAIFVENGDPTIVEAKMEPDPSIFSQLIHYARKFRMDPLWSQFASKPLTLVALVYSDDPSVAIEAPWYGIRWEVFQPALDTLAPPQVRLPIVEVAGQASYLPSDWASRLRSWGIKASSES